MDRINSFSESNAESILRLCSGLVNELFTASSINELVNISEHVFERFLPLDYSGLYLFNEELNKLELLIAQGFSSKEKSEAEKTAMQRHPGTVFKTGKEIYIPNTDEDSQRLTIDSPRSFIVKTRLYSPVEVAGKRIGVFGLVSSRIDAFSKTDIELFRFICKIVGKVYVNIQNQNKLLTLNKEQKILTFLATHTNNSVVLTDNKGLVTWVNDAFIKLTGYSLSEVKGKKPGELLQGKGSEAEVINNIGNALRGREFYNGVITNYSKTGEKYLVDLSIYPFYNDEGEFSNYISFQRNVTKEVAYQRQIENQKQRLDAILSSIPDILFVQDKSGQINECIVNKDYYKEIEPSKYIGSSIYDLVDAHDIPQIESHLNKVFNESSIQTAEIGINFNGKVTYVEFRTVKIDNNQALSLLRNINDKYLLDQERIQAQNFYELLSEFSIKFSLAEAEVIDDVINEFILSVGHVFNSAGVFLVELNSNENQYLSKSYAFKNNKWIIQEGEFDVENDFVIKSIHDGDEFVTLSYDSVKFGTNKGAINTIAQGLRLHVFESLTLLPLKQKDELIAFLGFLDLKSEINFSESTFSQLKLINKLVYSAISRKKYILELSRFKAIFDNGSFGAVIVNHRNEVVYLNSYVNNFFNNAGAPLGIIDANELFSNASETKNRLDYHTLIKEKDDEPNIIKVKKGDKESYLLLRHLILDVADRRPLIAISFINITDRINQENETKKAIDIVSEQNKKLLNFSYIVSHNIRSHVSNMIGFLSLAETEDDLERLQSYIKVLVKSSKSLDGTLKHLNELLNIQSRTGVVSVDIDLTNLFNKTIQSLASDLASIPNDIELSIPEGFLIKCDQAYADSIVLNLMSNAIKYRKQDEVLKIHVEAWSSDDQTYVKVSDNGKGIDIEKYGDKIFGMFKTFHGNSDARGIGLFITKNQIESLGGSISIESSPGNGAAFIIELPK
jgi:PAS domain S-box-containing protein